MDVMANINDRSKYYDVVVPFDAACLIDGFFGCLIS